MSGKGQAGASAGLTAEKNNHLLHEEQEAFTKEMGQAKNQEERFEVLEKYLEKSRKNKEKDPSGSEAMEKLFMDELTKLTKFDNAGISFVVNPELGLHENLKAAKAFFGTYNVVKYLPNVFSEGVKLTAIEVVGPIKVLEHMLIVGDAVYEITGSYNENGEVNSKFIKDIIFSGGKMVGLNTLNNGLLDDAPKAITIITDSVMITYVNKEWKEYTKERD